MAVGVDRRCRQIDRDSVESGRFGDCQPSTGVGGESVTDDRVIPLRRPKVAEPRTDQDHLDPESESAPVPADRVTMGVEVPADRRSVLMVQTIAQLATLAQEVGVPLDDGLAEGAERLARNLRGAGLSLPAHLESALEEISRALSPPEPERSSPGVVVPFRASSQDDGGAAGS